MIWQDYLSNTVQATKHSGIRRFLTSLPPWMM